MKYSLLALIALLAGCSSAPGNGYDVYSLHDAASTLRAPEPALPSGFVSLMEQQPDGTWVVRPDAALLP